MQKHQIRIVISIIIIQLFILIVFIASNGNPFRPDSERYFALAETLCADGTYFGPNERYRTGNLTVTDSKDLFSNTENLEYLVPEVFRTPGYPVFLCALEKAGIESEYSVVVTQYVLFLLTVFALWKLSEKLYGSRFSFRLVVLMLITPGGMVYALTLYSEILFLLFFSMSLLCIFLYEKKVATEYLLISAITFALAFYIKPSVLYIPFLIAVVFFTLRQKIDNRITSRLFLFICLFIIGISPWLLRNYQHYETPYVSGQMSNMLAIYHLPSVWNEVKSISESDARFRVREEVDNLIIKTEEKNQAYLNNVQILNLQQEFALKELTQHPWIYMKQWANGMYKTIKGGYSSRLYILLTGKPIHQDVNANSNILTKAGQTIAKAITKLELVFWILVVFLAAASVISGVWKLNPVAIISGICIAYFIFIPGSMGYSRFRFPIEWLLLIHALQSVDWITLRIRKNGVGEEK